MLARIKFRNRLFYQLLKYQSAQNSIIHSWYPMNNSNGCFQQQKKNSEISCNQYPIFKHDDTQKNKEYNDGGRIQWRWDLITSFLALLGLIELPKDSPLILAIKRGILAKQRKQYHKAEMILHAALTMAQDVANTDAEMYIFDVLADNYFEKGDYSRALDLYLEVLARFSQKESFTLDCEELIELSIKMAYCYGRLDQQENAEKGFRFSMDTQLKRTEPFWDDRKAESLVETMDDSQRNSLALLGMAYDYYSKHLQQLSSQLLEMALAYRLKALKISIAVNGEQHDQTLVLENDIADLYARMKKYDLAKNLLRRVIEKAKEMESIDLPIFYLNMASIHCQQNRQDLAKRFCREAFELVERTVPDDDELNEKDRLELLKKSELCLNGLKFY